MSISTELSRIQSNRNTIRAKLVELGMATGTDNLTVLATAIEGLVDKGAVSIEVREGETISIPAGYHNGGGTVKGVSGGGSYKLQAKTVTPTKNQQSVTPDAGYYGMESVIVAPIPDSYQDVSSVNTAAGDVLTGKVFVTSNGTVTPGTMPNNGTVTHTLTATEVSYTIPTGYHTGKGTVKITLDTKTVTPTKSVQDVVPTEGTVLGKVTVAAIPDKYIETDDADAVAANILVNKTAYVKGSKVTGMMPSNGATGGNIDGLTTTSYTIPAGHTTGGTVSLTSDIEEALAAI